MVKEWLSIASISTTEWTVDIALDVWWENMSSKSVPIQKALASLTMLLSFGLYVLFVAAVVAILYRLVAILK
jgi:hypothetical protein